MAVTATLRAGLQPLTIMSIKMAMDLLNLLWCKQHYLLSFSAGNFLSSQKYKEPI